MYKRGQVGLAIILGIIALVLGLIFALPVILPDSVKTMIENYKAEKLNSQIQSERIAALRGLPAISVLGHLTCIDGSKMLIHTTLRNVGGDYAINPTIKHIIVKDIEPGITKWLTVGRPIPGGFFNTSLPPRGKINFTINITDLAVREILIEDPNYKLQLDINTIYYSKSGHQFEETETVIVAQCEGY
jgi:hypothetical protein